METRAEMDRETLYAMEEIRQEDPNVESMDDPLSALDVEEDEGWEDLEPDVEEVTVQSLFDDKTFPDAQSMLQYCSDTFGFDFLKTRKELGTFNFMITVYDLYIYTTANLLLRRVGFPGLNPASELHSVGSQARQQHPRYFFQATLRSSRILTTRTRRRRSTVLSR